jgi:hypothetical protein
MNKEQSDENDYGGRLAQIEGKASRVLTKGKRDGKRLPVRDLFLKARSFHGGLI